MHNSYSITNIKQLNYTVAMLQLYTSKLHSYTVIQGWTNLPEAIPTRTL